MSARGRTEAGDRRGGGWGTEVAGRPGGPGVRGWRGRGRGRWRGRRGGRGRREVEERTHARGGWGGWGWGNTARGGCAAIRGSRRGRSRCWPGREVGGTGAASRGVSRQTLADRGRVSTRGEGPPVLWCEHVYPVLLSLALDVAHQRPNMEHVAPLHSTDGEADPDTTAPPTPRVYAKAVGRSVVGRPVSGCNGATCSMFGLWCATSNASFSTGSMCPLQHGGNLHSSAIPAPLRANVHLRDNSGGGGCAPAYSGDPVPAPHRSGVRKIHAST